MTLGRLPTLAAVLVVAAVTAGCGGGDLGGLGPLGGGGEPNETDTAFVRAMGPHSEEAVAMARIARKRALRKELRKIAKEIIGTRGEDTDRIRALAARVELPPPRRGGARMTRTPVDPKALRNPVSFDHRFLELMIRHHEEATAMAEEEQDRGGDVALKRLAGELLESHERELEKLRRWLHTWYGEGVLPGEGGGGPGGGGGEPDKEGGGEGEGDEPLPSPSPERPPQGPPV